MLEDCITSLLSKSATSTQRLTALADYLKAYIADAGLPGCAGGSSGELRVPGLARAKDWDVAYEFAGKFRLLISLKSLLRNISGTVPNRLDDLQGELANVQQLRPEIVIGYVVLFDVSQDSRRKVDGLMWSEFFEAAIQSMAIRYAPLWNQGLLEGAWLIRFDSNRPKGSRLVDAAKTANDGQRFIYALLSELKRREPAIPFTKNLPGVDMPGSGKLDQAGGSQ
jgi:hypothetical protein